MLTEKEFLLTLALSKYNAQYGLDIKIEDCDIFSIPVRYNANVSYEIYTVNRTDFIRLHIHLLIENSDLLYDYRIESDPYTNRSGEGNLTDEVYVAMGMVDIYYVNIGRYQFKPITEAYDNSNTLLMEDGYELLFESGEQIVLE